MEKDWVLSHVAVALREIDESIKYYDSTGVGVHTLRKLGPPTTPAVSVNLRNGKAVEGPAVGATPEEVVKMIQFIHVGDLQYECGMRGTVEMERSDHICFNVPDLFAESTRFIYEKGCEVPFVYINNSLIQENHIDTTKFGGIKISFRPDPDGKKSAGEQADRDKLPVSDWKFRGMGIAVEDMDKVVEYYRFLEMGTFQPEVAFDSSSIADFREDGKASGAIVRARTRTAQVGPVTFEFTQPLEGDTIYKAVLDNKGEGLNDFVFTVDDLDKETAKLAEKGIPAIRSGKPGAGEAFAYFVIHETRKLGDIMIKLVQA